MGVFKKLKGNDVRVFPIEVHTEKQGPTATARSSNYNPDTVGAVGIRSEFSDTFVKFEDNSPFVYNSIRQLYYGAYISQSFISSGSLFSTSLNKAIGNASQAVFSGYDPVIEGSYIDRSWFPTAKVTGVIDVLSYSVRDIGEGIVPGSVSGSGGYYDDYNGNLLNGSDAVVGNVFYDQGIIVGNDSTPLTLEVRGKYTIYQTQYKCTAEVGEFNYSYNRSLLTGSNVTYDPDIVDSPEFMPYVTTIGLYNDDQDLIMVAKLAKPVQLNPYTDTNFIVRIDK